MLKEDFQTYYNKNEYPGSIFYDYYVEHCNPDTCLSRDIFNRFFPIYRNIEDKGNKFLEDIIEYYVSKFSIRKRHTTVLLGKDGKILKQLEDIFDYVKET